MKRIFSILFTLLLMVNLSLVTAVPVMAATTYTVDDDWQVGVPPYAEDTDGDNDFATIQAAISGASSGDTIVVHKGEYHESVKIETDNITLEGVGKVILDGIDVDPVSIGDKPGILGIWISSGVTGVKITGFEIRNYGVWEELASEPYFTIEEFGIGIWLECDSHGNIVTGNKFSNCLAGIMASTSYDHIIEENELSDGLVGISVERSGHHNKVENNRITNHLAGIGVDEGSHHNIFEKNSIAKCSIVGIMIEGTTEDGYSCENNVIENRITNSGQLGIALGFMSSDNLIKENRVSGSGEYDLYENEFAGTGNIWEENKYKTSYPDPLP